MTRLFKPLVGLAAALALAGCMSSWEGIRDYWTLHTEDIQKLKPGMTQDEVVAIVGKPPWKLAIPAKQEEIWSYRYLDYHTRMRSSMHFDGKGVLKFATQEFDQDYYSGSGGNGRP